MFHLMTKYPNEDVSLIIIFRICEKKHVILTYFKVKVKLQKNEAVKFYFSITELTLMTNFPY